MATSEALSQLGRAVREAQRDLENRDYNSRQAVVYPHPATFKDAVSDTDRGFQIARRQTICGLPFRTTPNLPESVVMVVAVGQTDRSPDALAFSAVDDDSGM